MEAKVFSVKGEENKNYLGNILQHLRYLNLELLSGDTEIYPCSQNSDP